MKETRSLIPENIILLVVGLVLSALILVVSFRFDNPIINYLLGFSASIVVSSIINILADRSVVKKERNRIRKKRNTIFEFIDGKFRLLLFNVTPRNETNATYQNIDVILNNYFDSYCQEINNLVLNTPNEGTYFFLSNARHYIYDECLTPLKKYIDLLLDDEPRLENEAFLIDLKLIPLNF